MGSEFLTHTNFEYCNSRTSVNLYRQHSCYRESIWPTQYHTTIEDAQCKFMASLKIRKTVKQRQLKQHIKICVCCHSFRFQHVWYYRNNQAGSNRYKRKNKNTASLKHMCNSQCCSFLLSFSYKSAPLQHAVKGGSLFMIFVVVIWIHTTTSSEI